MIDSIHINRGHPSYPLSLYLHCADQAPETLTARGSLNLLRRKPLVALFCSVRCSEEIIAHTYDLAQALSDAGVTVISGFHSPMEKECLTTLLHHASPVVLCPARSIERLRLRNEWRTALLENRLLLLSPFAEQQRETTTKHALARNMFVAALADAVLIAHATPGGRLEQLCDQVVSWGKPVAKAKLLVAETVSVRKGAERRAPISHTLKIFHRRADIKLMHPCITRLCDGLRDHASDGS